MKPNSKHMEWADKILNGLHVEDFSPKENIAEIAQHLAAFEAEVREDMAETHVDKADAWDATIRAGKRLIDLNGWRIDMENMPETIKFVARRSDGKIETVCRYNNPFGSERPTVINTATGKWFEPIAWYPLPPDDSREITLPAQPEKEGK